ncbi:MULTISPECIES: hypothetical protein [unclassified Streptomyces]|jgi:hypothetical protein|uniref:hypothetical protein n=1 Tax=unclassified Streptomyces TaxID=2593676 RepID=UPI00114F6F8C|nr:hypothetical protein [Streptomyces sp. SLBN-31]TQJ85689.1 hypothetical protein FBY22_4482 [Streptomyces sp. SLBN-31]
MDPATLVVQALVTGAAAGLSGAASATVTDSYRALREALSNRLSGRPGALEQIGVLERRPTAPAEGLVRELVVTGAVDTEVTEHAQRLLALLSPAAAHLSTGGIDLSQAKGVQVGHGTTQNNTFH